MASWLDLSDLAAKACESVFGTRIRIRPMLKKRLSNAPADETRPVTVVVGEFARTPSSERLIPGKSAGSTGAMMLSAPATVTLRAGTIATLGYAVREGDRVEIIDEAGSPAFDVAEVHQIDGGNVMLVLVKAGAA